MGQFPFPTDPGDGAERTQPLSTGDEERHLIPPGDESSSTVRNSPSDTQPPVLAELRAAPKPPESSVGDPLRRSWRPERPEHQRVLDELPANVPSPERSYVGVFLCHLESLGMAWSDVAPSAGESRPSKLEETVNHETERGLDRNVRSALNRAFGLKLQPERGGSRHAPELEEHKALMRQVPPHIEPSYRSKISRLLWDLEQHGTRWSELVPDAAERRPEQLEAWVNAAIERGLHANTRAALDKAFNLQLQGRHVWAPRFADHQELIKTLPRDLRPPYYRSDVLRFFCYLEERQIHWSELAPPEGEMRSARLEEEMDRAIAAGLPLHVRSAINQAFHLKLKSAGKREFKK